MVNDFVPFMHFLTSLTLIRLTVLSGLIAIQMGVISENFMESMKGLLGGNLTGSGSFHGSLESMQDWDSGFWASWFGKAEGLKFRGNSWSQSQSQSQIGEKLSVASQSQSSNVYVGVKLNEGDKEDDPHNYFDSDVLQRIISNL